jgi:hypothetical protein
MMCSSATCKSVATLEVFWPGQTRRMCQQCADKAQRIANALGFKLEARALLPTPPTLEELEKDGTQ